MTQNANANKLLTPTFHRRARAFVRGSTPVRCHHLTSPLVNLHVVREHLPTVPRGIPRPLSSALEQRQTLKRCRLVAFDRVATVCMYQLPQSHHTLVNKQALPLITLLRLTLADVDHKRTRHQV